MDFDGASPNYKLQTTNYKQSATVRDPGPQVLVAELTDDLAGAIQLGHFQVVGAGNQRVAVGGAGDHVGPLHLRLPDLLALAVDLGDLVGIELPQQDVPIGQDIEIETAADRIERHP